PARRRARPAHRLRRPACRAAVPTRAEELSARDRLTFPLVRLVPLADPLADFSRRAHAPSGCRTSLRDSFASRCTVARTRTDTPAVAVAVGDALGGGQGPRGRDR